MEPGWKEAMLRVPQHLRPGLELYVFQGVEPGGFLCAMIDQDLGEVLGRAGDTLILYDLKKVQEFFFNFCPAQCWGSKNKRKMWQAAFRGPRPPEVHR